VLETQGDERRWRLSVSAGLVGNERSLRAPAPRAWLPAGQRFLTKLISVNVEERHKVMNSECSFQFEQ
jgi:hypothetical protein